MPAASDLASWRACPRCGEALEHEDNSVRCPACGLSVYANPAPTASAIVLDGRGRVLLARRAVEPGKGRWDLLGGFIDEDEDPLAALRRELAEEIGLDVQPGDFVGGFPDRYGEDGPPTLNLYWTARLDGEPQPSDEIAELRWFEPEALPDRGEFAFANTVEALQSWREK
jgi:8-oxo-dGTP pyrophosphatase MutT (NUDIX family)